MRIVSFIFELLHLAGIYAAFFSVVVALVFLLYRHVYNAQVTPRVLLRTALVYVGMMYVLNSIAIIAWYLFMDSLVQMADAWLPVVFILPISWDIIFDGFSLTNYEPLSPLYTTGQIANLYYGISLVMSSIAYIVCMLLSKKATSSEQRQKIYTMLFFVQLCIFGILCLYSI